MDNFTLMDAMSAFEVRNRYRPEQCDSDSLQILLQIGEPRLDSGMILEEQRRPPFDPLAPLLPEEVCWILDRSFACEVNDPALPCIYTISCRLYRWNGMRAKRSHKAYSPSSSYITCPTSTQSTSRRMSAKSRTQHARDGSLPSSCGPQCSACSSAATLRGVSCPKTKCTMSVLDSWTVIHP